MTPTAELKWEIWTNNGGVEEWGAGKDSWGEKVNTEGNSQEGKNWELGRMRSCGGG